MRRALLVALAVAACAMAPGDRAAAQTQVERLREACLGTDMRHELFDNLYKARGLTPLIPMLRPGEEPNLAEWSSGYDDGGVQIVMSGAEAAAEPSHATDCGVLTPMPAGDWRADVEALARELGMRPATPVEMPNTLEARAWTAKDGAALTLNYEVYRGAVVVRFARPAASSQ